MFRLKDYDDRIKVMENVSGMNIMICDVNDIELTSSDMMNLKLLLTKCKAVVNNIVYSYIISKHF